MTYLIQIGLHLILYSLTIAFPQVNFHRTNPALWEYDCLRVSMAKQDLQEIVSFCLTEPVSQRTIAPHTTDRKFAFDDLQKQNITSEQLYQWSAPIDLIEEYEAYRLSQPTDGSNAVFYNCTKPRFGSHCQYEFVFLPSENLPLNDLLSEFYQLEHTPRSLPCYVHLDCDQGAGSSCLDWSEICNDYVNCMNDQIDERDCWQVQSNECKEDEYRCSNGQCVSKHFALDIYVRECLDQPNDLSLTYYPPIFPRKTLPTLYSENMRCVTRDEIYFTPLYGIVSCDPWRGRLLGDMRLGKTPKMLSNICFIVLSMQIFRSRRVYVLYNDLCWYKKCWTLLNNTCSELTILPASPMAFGHVYVAFLQRNDEYASFLPVPDYICYDEQLCRGFQSNNVELKISENRTCRRTEDTPVSFHNPTGRISVYNAYSIAIHKYLPYCNIISVDHWHMQNNSFFYCCGNSSHCISVHRLCDTVSDCADGDDEVCPLINGNCLPKETNALYKCPFNRQCISWRRVFDSTCDCPHPLKADTCEDETFNMCDVDHLETCGKYSMNDYLRNHISFENMCDGWEDLAPIIVDGRNHTDETECQEWNCSDTYGRCDKHPISYCTFAHCPSDSYVCMDRAECSAMCLPLKEADDDRPIDLRYANNLESCRLTGYNENLYQFHCSPANYHFDTPCREIYELTSSDCVRKSQSLFCNLHSELRKPRDCPNVDHYKNASKIRYPCPRLSQREIGYFSLGEEPANEVAENRANYTPPIERTFEYDFSCHRGYPLRRRIDSQGHSTALACFCPQSYYGEFCQYQNQRVSLTLQFQTYLDSRRTVFSIVVQLIDDSTRRAIHSSKQLTFIYIKHCRTKFEFYLTYATRPKNTNQTYSIHIDVYEKSSLGYRGSFLRPLKYPFLPVHRTAYVLIVPQSNESLTVDCPEEISCLHGRCMRYADGADEQPFCHCQRGWSGKDCSIRYACSCAQALSCVGIGVDNRSICICPHDRWGPRCFLQNTICQSDTNSSCLNLGQCILTDDELISSAKFFCLCPTGFSGDRCEIEDVKIILSFDHAIRLFESVLVHFIEVRKNGPVRNGSTFQSIPLYGNELVIRWSHRFHIVFIRLPNQTYYLIDVERDFRPSRVIRKSITPSDRCGQMSEYVNETISNYPLIRRMKYYHLACQRQISCFYDQRYFCLCNEFGSQRRANCFQFDFTVVLNCSKLGNCQNGGQCVQDDLRCPQTSRCICQQCSYGSLCQFRSSLFDLSLDGIIGWHIQPNLSLRHQPAIVQTSFGLIIVTVMAGLLDGSLSLLTFQSKETRKVGCGYYLLVSTITTILISIVLSLKFSVLLLAQMSIIQNRKFLMAQCYSVDYFLQVFLNMNRWLQGCVAMERAVNTIEGTQFNTAKSRTVAKWMIGGVLFFTATATIHEPIHRRLVDDDSLDEQTRTWCIVSYSSQLRLLNQFVHMLHFFMPFLLNIISTSLIIIMATRRRRAVQKKHSHRQILREQIRKHRHLLVAPIMLVILSLPRLLISLIAGCMQSNRSPWLYLIAYLISFLPSMLTLMIFVLPSKLYRQEFRQNTVRHYQTIRTRIPCV